MKKPHNITVCAQLSEEQRDKLDRWAELLGRPWTRSKIMSELVESVLPDPLSNEQALKIDLRDLIIVNDDAISDHLATAFNGTSSEDGNSIKYMKQSLPSDPVVQDGLISKLLRIGRFISSVNKMSS